jgi:formylglycine-generating enzyme required for sulfatase activity
VTCALAASGLVAMASCFPGYSFLAAGAADDAGGDAALVDGTAADATSDAGATPDTALPGTGEGGTADGAPPSGMVAIHGGTFDFIVNGPSLHATLDYDFYIDAKEVTVARFKQWVTAGLPLPCSGSQPCALDTKAPYATAMYWDPAWNTVASEPDFTGGPDCGNVGGLDVATFVQQSPDAYPVTCVNWAQAAAFCWSEHKRLPTTTEWYYVATGAGAWATAYPWGTATPDCTVAILDTCSWPQPVGTAGPQIMGVYDLIGSVSEWTWDSIDPAFTYPLDATDFAGLAFDGGVDTRNSFWINSQYSSAASTLDGVAAAGPKPQYGWPNLGFRCAMTQ